MTWFEIATASYDFVFSLTICWQVYFICREPLDHLTQVAATLALCRSGANRDLHSQY